MIEIGQIFHRILQQTAGVVVQPALEGLGIVRIHHAAPECGGKVIVCQGLDRLLLERHILIHPQRRRQFAGCRTVVNIVGHPELIRKFPAVLDRGNAQQIQKFRTGLPIRSLCPHRQRQPDVDRRADRVLARFFRRKEALRRLL